MALWGFGAGSAQATPSGGTGTAADPYVLTSSDAYMDLTGKYYTNTAALLDYGNIQVRVGSTLGDVHLVLSTAGTVMKAGSIRVGYPAGFTNYADISNGATLQATGSFTFGFYGRGEVTLHDGGVVICDAGTSFVGYNTGSSGNVYVNSGSTLTYVGSLDIAYFYGSEGNITVDGATSQLVCGSGGSLLVGCSGASGASPAASGTITLQNGGTLNSHSSQVGIGYDGAGTVTMSSGAVWTNSGSTYVGWRGAATGTLSLTGSGTRFTNTNQVTIGNSTATGTLTVADSALAAFGASGTPLSTGANGTIRLNGGYLAIKSSSPLSASTIVATYNLLVYSGGSYVAATIGTIGTRYFNPSTPWSSDPLYATYGSSIDLTGYTLVFEQISSAPTVTSPTSASVTASTATLGGNVTSDGGNAITARGVVYARTATNNNPQIGGAGVTNVVATGTTIGVFTVNVSSLTASTGYTYAAYATNGLGTTYSATGTFTTSAAPPAPTVTSVTSSTANGAYRAGDTISIQVGFSGGVTVDTTSGTPTLTLETGTTDRAAIYAGGSGTPTLTFTYTVQAGDTSSDLDYVTTGSLALNGGTIKDATSIDAILTLPTPGAAGSLGANKAIVIDTTAPTTVISTVAFSADSGASPTDFITNIAAQTIAGTLSANLATGESVQVSLDNGATWVAATTSAGSNTWALSGQTLTSSSTLKVRVSDAVGNTGTEFSQLYTFDTTAPTISFSAIGFSADTGSSATDFITKEATQTIIVTLSAVPAGTDIVYGSLDGGSSWTDLTSKVSGTTLTWNSVVLTASGTLKLKVTDAAGNDGTVASQAYTLDTVAPVFTSATTDSGTYGTAYSYTITATGAATSYGASGLPAGVSLSGATLSGTPSESGSFAASLSATDAAGNTATTTLTLSVAKATVTPSITASSRTYDGTNAATIASRSLSGVLGSDDVSLTGGTATFDTKDKGTGKTVTATGLSLSGTKAGNYELSSTTATTTANLTAATLTVSGITAANKTYNGNATAALSTGGAALVGKAAADAVTLDTTSAAGAFPDKMVGAGRTVTISGLTISGADAGNYTLTQPTTTADITAAPLTVTGVTASNKVYDGGTSATIVTTGAALSGVLGSDVVTLGTSSAAGTFADKVVATGKTVTVSGLSISGADAGNYSLTQPTATAAITAKELTVTGITANNRAYNGTTAATLSTAGATLVGVASGDAVTLSTATATGVFADSDVGSAKTVMIAGLTITGADAPNYTLTQPTTTASITEATVSISLSNLNQVYDGTPKAVSVSVSPSVPVTISYNGGGSGAPVNAGSYNVTVSASGSYTGSASGTLVIAKAPQTITFPTAPVSSSIVLNATSSTGLPVTYTVVSGPGVVAGATLTITDSGNVVVRASQAGNNNYQSATAVQTFGGLSRKAQTIDFAPIADRVLGSGAVSLTATATSGLPVSFAVVSGPAMLNGTSLSLTGTGTVVVCASQPGNTTYAAAQDVTQSFQVVINAPRIYFGDCRGSSGGTKVGDVAAYLPPTGDAGTLLLVIPGSSVNASVDFQLGAGGMFTTTVTAPGTSSSDHTERVRAAAARAITVHGSLVGSVLSGVVDELGLQFSAPITATTGSAAPIAGYYESSTLNTNMGSAASIVSAQGQVLVVASTSTLTTGGLGTVNSSGSFTVSATGATITGAVDAPTTTVYGTINVAGGASVPFSGLNTVTQRNDRMMNLSSRVRVGQADRVLISGFVISGSAPKQILLRAVGPGLSGFGIQGALANPRIRLYGSDGKVIAENDDWGSAASAASVAGAAIRVGAFSLKDGSGDAALLITLQPGAYSAQVLDGGDTGVALSEVYDASSNPQTEYQRLVNISTRGESGPGENVLIGGFIVVGNAPKKVLVRGIGPALTAYGVAGALTDPRLRVYRGTDLIGENDNWSAVAAEAANVADAASKTGAFALTNGSKDAAVLLTLAPGAYTAQVSGNGTDTGVALVEIYEIAE